MHDDQFTRRGFLRSLAAIGAAALGGATLAPRRALAFGDETHFTFGILRYNGGNWNPRPEALRRLLLELEVSTSVLIQPTERVATASLASLMPTPITFLAGDRAFPEFSESERSALRSYVSAGGILVVDSSEGRMDGPFRESVERELSHILPGRSLTRIDSDHVILKSFYLCTGAEGRVEVSDHLEGIDHDGHLAVVYSHNDLMGAWARDRFGNYEYQMHPGGERQRQMTYRMGVNLAMYALCLDYKQDQVHVPFILRRRRWRVE